MKLEENMEEDEKFYARKFKGILKGNPNISYKIYMNDAYNLVYDELVGEDEPKEIEEVWIGYKPIAQEIWNEHKTKEVP